MPPPADGFTARLVLGPALRTQPDRRLVRLVRDGYETAFEEIVRRYGKPLTRYAAAIVGSHAEDVTQDAFSKALLALRRDGAEIELRPWLFRIVRNTALNDLRDSPPTPELLAEAIASGEGPAEELERREELADLMRRLQSLPEAQRAAIVMRELEGLSHDEIAAALGLSGGAARQAIFRARRALRDGAGMLLPLPLLKALLAGTAAAPVEAATSAAGLGGAASAGVAIKTVTATVLVAGAVGAGVAIDNNRHASAPEPARASGVVEDDASTDSSSSPSATSEAGDNSRGSDSSGRGGETEPGDDHGGRRGPSGHGDIEGGDDDGGHHPGQGPSGPSGSGSDSSSHGSGSSGPGGGTSSGSGHPDSSGPGPASGLPPSGGGSGSGPDGGSSSGGSGSGGGEGSSGDSGGGSDSPTSDDLGDSHGGDGFSLQTEPQS